MRQEKCPGRDKNATKAAGTHKACLPPSLPAGRADRGPAKGLKLGKVVFPGAFTLAGTVLILSAAMSVRPDPEVERLLDSAPLTEVFQKNRVRDARDTTGQESPLVAHAAAFALLINPPKPIKRSDSQTVRQCAPGSAPVRRVEVPLALGWRKPYPKAGVMPRRPR